MKLMTVQCQCSRCGAAMTIEVEPPENDAEGVPLVDLTPFIRMATCRACVPPWVNFEKRKQANLPIEAAEPKLPYNDQ